MPRRPQSDVEPQLRRRAELAIKLANEWLSVMNASQRGLARRLGADQSVLSRFLSQQPGYEPARNRPRILKLLEDIEQVCTHLEDVSLVPEDEPFDALDDVTRWEDALRIRLRQLRHEVSPGKALTRFPELCVQALHFPGASRSTACINAALAASVLLFEEWRTQECSEQLVRETAHRAELLEAATLAALDGLDLADQVHDRHAGRCWSYVGVAMSYSGLRLDDEALLARGVELQLKAARTPSKPEDRVWHNLLALLNVLLEEDHACSREAALRAAEVGRSHADSGLQLALADRDVGALLSCWSEIAPDLLEEQ